jgi:hypothetical protein
MDQRFDLTIPGQLTPEWMVDFDGMKVICLADGNTLIKEVFS